MHSESIERWRHHHAFGTEVQTLGEKRTLWVIGLTSVAMFAEILAGKLYGSMALLADGFHMATHAAALGVTVFAYVYARRHARDPRFSFGTGKVAFLGGFASAIGLFIVAVLVLFESAERLLDPVAIHFNEAFVVAVVGLVVNLICALLLGGAHDHGGGHGRGTAGHEADGQGGHGHAHGSAVRHTDHNLRAAYLHVLADALTSVLAIAALLVGKVWGWLWMDPAMGVVGAVVIARWSIGLLRDTSHVLLDAEASAVRKDDIVRIIESESDSRIADLHLWRVGPGHFAAIVSIVTHQPRDPAHYKNLLVDFPELAHVTVEVHPRQEQSERIGLPH